MYSSGLFVQSLVNVASHILVSPGWVGEGEGEGRREKEGVSKRKRDRERERERERERGTHIDIILYNITCTWIIIVFGKMT